MSSLNPKDRMSLCTFTFSDGRRCRTPRIGNHPHFCLYHAQKEARARAAEKLGKDLAYFFSGDYLSACDLSTALARLIPAVVHGDVKPRTARTIAYLAQTLMQAIHISQHEYCEAFSSDAWRKSIRNSVKGNHDYLFPPTPKSEQPTPSALRTNLWSESAQPQPQPAPPSNAPHPTAVAHPFRGEAFPSQPQTQQAASTTSSNPPWSATRPTPAAVAHPFRGEAFPPASLPKATPPQPAEISASCHSERSAPSALRMSLRSEEPAFSSSPVPPPTSAHAPQTPAAILTTSFTRSAAPASQHDNPPGTGPSTPQPTPNRVARALHFDHRCRLLIDGKLF